MKSIVLGIFISLVFCGCGERAKIAYKVIDEQGKPIAGAKIVAGYMTGGSWSGDIPYKYHNKDGVTDNNGTYVYKARIKHGVTAGVEKEGYYKTITEEIFEYELKKGIRNYVTDPIVVVLKNKFNPIPMYAKKVNHELPNNVSTVGYDLVKGDLVSPFGSGEINDLLFYINGNSVKNVTFSNKQDGIQPFFVRDQYQPEYKIPHYELRSSQKAPLSGYCSSLTEADGNWKDIYKKEEYRKVERYWENEINYYFRVRSNYGGSAQYGKVYGYFLVDSHPGSSSRRLKFTYYLNADRNNNVEFAPGKSYFSSSPAIGAENPPHQP